MEFLIRGEATNGELNLVSNDVGEIGFKRRWQNWYAREGIEQAHAWNLARQKSSKNVASL